MTANWQDSVRAPGIETEVRVAPGSNHRIDVVELPVAYEMRVSQNNLEHERPLCVEAGNRITSARKARSVTQEALARHVSVTRTSITNIEQERQNLPLHMFAELAAALHVPPAALLPGGLTHEDADLDQALEGRPSEEQSWIRSALGSREKGE
jgi:transcriptional regulator with XRE-family HTH domain